MDLKYLVAKVIICLVVFVPSHVSRAQSKNLVINPSFEQYKNCPERPTPFDGSHKLVPHWSYPTMATPDYFNKCGTGEVRVPSNFAGNSQPQDGDAYVGAILSGSEENYREYVEGKLSEPMQAGERYCVTFWYKLASYSRFSVDQLSVYITNDPVRNSLKTSLNFKPQITNKPGLFLDNIDEWKQMCKVYTAKGGEQFFIIGNFKDYDNTNYVVTDKNVVNKRDKEYAYYFFDNVAVRKLENCNDCPCVPQDMDVVLMDTSYTGGFNPYTGKIDNLVNDGSINIAVTGGTPPYKINWSSGHEGFSLTNLPAGKYTYKVHDAYNCRGEGTVVFTRPKLPETVVVEEYDIEEGSSIVLENIFFEFNKTKLLPSSFEELDKVVEFVLNNDIKLIEISGHTDSKGSESYNQKLSEGRAKSVMEYLISQGIESDRITFKGYGESKPIDTNKTEEGQARNRRVEFKIIKM
jgi:outer membrane protein OmpA-like peptidoglycan-associated protein